MVSHPLTVATMALACSLVAAPVAAQEVADEEGSDEASAGRYPEYVTAGAVTLGAGVALGITGAVVGATQDDPKAAVGLGGLATTALGVGLPLVLLGATPKEPQDAAMAYGGIALATPGVLALGLGGSLMMFREFEPPPEDPNAPPPGEPDRIAPIILMAGGAAATVAGIVVWSIGAEPADSTTARRSPVPSVSLSVSPGFAQLSGSF